MQGQISIRNARYRRACCNSPVFKLAPCSTLRSFLVPDVLTSCLLVAKQWVCKHCKSYEINSVERPIACVRRLGSIFGLPVHMVSQLVLVRHGQSVYNDENRFTGWADVQLTAEGYEEAVQVQLATSGAPKRMIFMGSKSLALLACVSLTSACRPESS